MWYEWIFSGIGTTILASVFSLIVGLIGGYQIGIHKHGKQTQKGGNEAKQKQVLVFGDDVSEKESGKKEMMIRQKQTAGDKAVQIQIGGTKRGNK